MLYSGLSLSLTHFANQQQFPFLRGNQHTFQHYATNQSSASSKFGKENILLLGIQGLNNARFLASGSLDIFSNDFYNKFDKGGNRQLAHNSVSWLIGERGVVREVTGSRRHGCTGLEGKQEIGTIDCPVRSKFRFETELEFWNWETNQWAPYVDDSLYLEITMMSPKFRQYFTPDPANPGKYVIEQGVS